MTELFLGVDGGGTRCRARLETAEGRALGSGLAGPASLRLGVETARKSIMTAARQALQEASLPEQALNDIYAGIGLAGIGQRGARAALESWRHPFAGVWFEGDGYVAYLGAFGGAEGGVVIAGTGSIGLAYQGKKIRIGGYGFPVSDEGGGADLGLNALRHALRTLDGRDARSALAQDVLAKFGRDPAQVLDWMEEASAGDYGALAPLVVEHARAGDEAAQSLMRRAAGHIAELVEALFINGAPQVALVGGLADALRDYMPGHIAQQLAAPQADAMAGAILLAKKKRAAAMRRTRLPEGAL
jgi:glucosamine kinase